MHFTVQQIVPIPHPAALKGCAKLSKTTKDTTHLAHKLWIHLAKSQAQHTVLRENKSNVEFSGSNIPKKVGTRKTKGCKNKQYKNETVKKDLSN